MAERNCSDCGRVKPKMRRGFCGSCYERRRVARDLPPRTCRDCGIEIPLKRGQRMEIASCCDDCRGEHERILSRLRYAHVRDTDAELHRQRTSAQNAARGRWAQTPSGRLLEYAKRYRQNTGIAIYWPEMAAMLEAQDYRCAICRREISFSPGRGTARNAHLDHCHRTNRVRGWLCSPCNRALGMIRDDPAVLRAAADYLEVAASMARSARSASRSRRHAASSSMTPAGSAAAVTGSGADLSGASPVEATSAIG